MLEGESLAGVPIDSWNYKAGMPHGMDTDRRYRGTVAQELPEQHAHACVRGSNGYWLVDYSLLDVGMEVAGKESGYSRAGNRGHTAPAHA